MDSVLLACIFAPLTLVERLRLTVVSKQWLRLLLADLRFPREHLWRALPIVRRAGDALRSLHVASIQGTFDGRHTLAGILRALRGGAGAQLRTFIMWEPPSAEEDAAGLAYPTVALSPKQALQLRTTCPRLGASTRLAFHAKAAEAIAVLDAVPGRHAVSLEGNVAEEDEVAESPQRAAEGAAQRALVRNPRLCALFLNDVYSRADWYCFGAAFEAVADALRRGDPTALALEHLFFDAAEDCVFYEELDAFSANSGSGSDSDEDDEEAAASALPAGAPTARKERRSNSLKSLSIVRTPPLLKSVHRIIDARHDGLRHLSIIAADKPGGEGGAEGKMSRLLGGASRPLESITVLATEEDFDDRPVTYIVPPITTLLGSADCRLRALELEDISLSTLAEKVVQQEKAQERHPKITELDQFSTALASNRSLTAIELKYLHWEGPELVQLTTALAARSAPLRKLCLTWSMEDLSPAGALRRPLVAVSPCVRPAAVVLSVQTRSALFLSPSVHTSCARNALSAYPTPLTTPCAAVTSLLGCNLQELSLSYCRLSEEAFEALGAALSTNSNATLTSLRVVRNKETTSRACTAVLQGLSNNTTLQSFRWCARVLCVCTCLDDCGFLSRICLSFAGNERVRSYQRETLCCAQGCPQRSSGSRSRGTPQQPPEAQQHTPHSRIGRSQRRWRRRHGVRRTGARREQLSTPFRSRQQKARRASLRHLACPLSCGC